MQKIGNMAGQQHFIQEVSNYPYPIIYDNESDGIYLLISMAALEL